MASERLDVNVSGRLTEAARWITIGFLFILFGASSIDKWLHFGNFLNAVRGYVLTPEGYAQTVGIFVASFELWLAIGFVVQSWRRMASAMAFALLLVFAGALFANYHFGVLTPCGCWYSVTLSEATPAHVVFDLFLAGLAGTLWFDRSLQGGANRVQ
jgi:hypothetical protein